MSGRKLAKGLRGRVTISTGQTQSSLNLQSIFQSSVDKVNQNARSGWSCYSSTPDKSETSNLGPGLNLVVAPYARASKIVRQQWCKLFRDLYVVRFDRQVISGNAAFSSCGFGGLIDEASTNSHCNEQIVERDEYFRKMASGNKWDTTTPENLVWKAFLKHFRSDSLVFRSVQNIYQMPYMYSFEKRMVNNSVLVNAVLTDSEGRFVAIVFTEQDQILDEKLEKQLRETISSPIKTFDVLYYQWNSDYMKGMEVFQPDISAGLLMDSTAVKSKPAQTPIAEVPVQRIIQIGSFNGDSDFPGSKAGWKSLWNEMLPHHHPSTLLSVDLGVLHHQPGSGKMDINQLENAIAALPDCNFVGAEITGFDPDDADSHVLMAKVASQVMCKMQPLDKSVALPLLNEQSNVEQSYKIPHDEKQKENFLVGDKEFKEDKEVPFIEDATPVISSVEAAASSKKGSSDSLEILRDFRSAISSLKVTGSTKRKSPRKKSIATKKSVTPVDMLEKQDIAALHSEYTKENSTEANQVEEPAVLEKPVVDNSEISLGELVRMRIDQEMGLLRGTGVELSKVEVNENSVKAKRRFQVNISPQMMDTETIIGDGAFIESSLEKRKTSPDIVSKIAEDQIQIEGPEYVEPTIQSSEVEEEVYTRGEKDISTAKNMISNIRNALTKQ